MEKISVQQTKEVLNSFYEDNLSFWQKEKERTGDVQGKIEELALNDVRSITTNPYSPNGALLDDVAKEEWIAKKSAAINMLEKEDTLDLSKVDDPYGEALVIQENNGLLSNKVEWSNETFLTHLKNNNPKEFEVFLALKDMYEKENERNFLGTVIYTPDNKYEQVLLVENLKTNQRHEYQIDKNLYFEHNGQRHSLNDVLERANINDLQSSIRANEPVSFMLNKEELRKLESRGLIQDNQPEIDVLKKQLDGMKNENKQLQQDNEKLQAKFNTIERFFKQDKSALKSFNQFLNDEKTINSPGFKEKELMASKKQNGLEL